MLPSIPSIAAASALIPRLSSGDYDFATAGMPAEIASREQFMIYRQGFIVILVAGLLGAASAGAQEKKIKRADLPPAVEKTVAAQSAGATVRGFSQEKEKGQIYYEAEMTVNGHSKDVLMDANGAIVEVEEEVAIDALPAAVKAGLQSKAGSGKIVKVETLTRHDKLVAYEAQVNTNGKKSEVQVGPDGKPLDHEE
jgi:hypothetical protein